MISAYTKTFIYLYLYKKLPGISSNSYVQNKIYVRTDFSIKLKISLIYELSLTSPY